MMKHLLSLFILLILLTLSGRTAWAQSDVSDSLRAHGSDSQV